VFIPVFTYLGALIPNYGIVIIILAILMKIVLYPLTKSSYRSMARMRELQPKMEEIKEKYGDNPQKQQEAMMKMYRETGVNPLGSCLPMFLQWPVIIALWQFLPQAIEIRQKGFLWAHDLSAPDVILDLPFNIPLYGDFVAGFTLLMGLSMVVQMRIQMASAPSNPQTKMFTYLMPVMIFAFFNRLAAGLSLYYLCFNILSAAQQKLINRSIEKEKEQKEGSNGKANSKIARDAKSAVKNKKGRGGKSKRSSKAKAR
jgi:YidC/Oxa1 family membrane protein insertase